MALSRVRSPAKTLLKSPAQRNRLIARNSSSPARGAIVRDDDAPQSSSQPSHDQAASKRRLDFRSVERGGPHSLSQPVASGSSRGQSGLANGHRLQPLPQDDDGKDEGAGHPMGSDHGAIDDDEVNNFVEESMAMLNDVDDHDVSPRAEPQQDENDGGDGEDSMVAGESAHAPAKPKKRGRPPKQKQSAPPARPADPPKKSARRVVEEREDEGAEDEQEDAEEAEEGPAPEPQKPEPKRRGRPPKAGKAQAAEQRQRQQQQQQQPPRGPRKRRSLGEEGESSAAKEPSPEPQPKRQRTELAAKKATAKQPAAEAAAEASTTSSGSRPAAPATKGGRGRKRKSSVDAGDVSQVVVARRPPLPKSRGLLINRREVPGESGAMFRTRSGRNSYKPLAYWRNERVDYDRDETEDPFVGRSRRSRFVLPTLTEVVRVDEPAPEPRPRPRARGRGPRPGRGRRKSRDYLDDGDGDGDDGPAEPWELDPGTVTGEVVVWQPEYEHSPPAPNDLVSVMDKQLAISAAAIKTTEVVGGEFRYAKVFSEGFIGAGVVDLPPGSVKRLKNSRKVFMIFFVHSGRVLATVQETSFRISKGGIFIVPRCKCFTVFFFFSFFVLFKITLLFCPSPSRSQVWPTRH